MLVAALWNAALSPCSTLRLDRELLGVDGTVSMLSRPESVMSLLVDGGSIQRLLCTLRPSVLAVLWNMLAAWWCDVLLDRKPKQRRLSASVACSGSRVGTTLERHNPAPNTCGVKLAILVVAGCM